MSHDTTSGGYSSSMRLILVLSGTWLLGACGGDLARSSPGGVTEAGAPIAFDAGPVPPSVDAQPTPIVDASQPTPIVDAQPIPPPSSDSGPVNGGCPSPAKPGTTPTLLGQTMSAAFIAVDCSTLYVAPYEVGVVTAFSLADGSSRTLNPVAATTLAIDATRVYSVSPSGGNEPQGLVIACPKTGCGAGYTTLASGQTGVWGVAVDDASVYWTVQGPSASVLKAPLSGGPPVTLVADGGGANVVAVAGGNVFYAGINSGSGGSALLMSVPVAGGSPTVWFTPTTGNSVEALATDADNVYWATTDGLVYELPLVPGPRVTLASGQGNGVSTIATDAQYVYWGTSAGDLVKAPIGGGKLTTLASGQTPVTSVAVDTDNVYWSSFGAGTVMMRVK